MRGPSPEHYADRPVKPPGLERCGPATCVELRDHQVVHCVAQDARHGGGLTQPIRLGRVSDEEVRQLLGREQAQYPLPLLVGRRQLAAVSLPPPAQVRPRDLDQPRSRADLLRRGAVHLEVETVRVRMRMVHIHGERLTEMRWFRNLRPRRPASQADLRRHTTILILTAGRPQKQARARTTNVSRAARGRRRGCFPSGLQCGHVGWAPGPALPLLVLSPPRPLLPGERR